MAKTIVALSLLFMLQCSVLKANESTDRIISQIFQTHSILPLTPEEAYEVSTFDSSRQRIFAEVQVRYAQHYLTLLDKLDLSTNDKLVRNLKGLHAEWRVILHRYEEAERVSVEALAKAREEEATRRRREIYYQKQELNIAKLRTIGADRSADEFEEKLRHEQMLDQMKTKK